MGKLRVLMYHKVHQTHADFLTVKAADLQWQLDHLSKHYTFVKLSQVLEHIQSAAPLPDNALLVTFDDGYADNYTLAYPAFKKRALPFAVFLVAAYVGKTTMHDGLEQTFLSTQQMDNMSDLAEFAYHSLNHENLMQLDSSKWSTHIQDCKLAFNSKSLLNAWAYTYGQYPKRNKTAYALLTEVFKANQIIAAFRIGNRINQTPINDPFQIERIDIRGNDSKLLFKLKTRFGKLI